jgi:N-methylhydantoinase A/oxoprolinase/acetone carboxylase beta subunit
MARVITAETQSTGTKFLRASASIPSNPSRARPLVDPKNVIGISERLSGGSYLGNIHLDPGHELIPVNEAQVRAATEKLIAAGCEVIGILFLYSFVDPRHEHRARDIANEVLAQHGKEPP